MGLALASACGQLPPITAEGDHVRVGSDVVAEICRGTVARLDHTSEYLADYFDLAADLTHDVYIIPAPDDAWCGEHAAGCATKSRAILLQITSTNGDEIYGLAVHEFAHNYVLSAIGRRRAFFNEGLASAPGFGECDPGFLSASLEDLLGASSSAELGMLGGYCPASRLMHWLIEVEGPAAVLDFCASLSRSAKPSRVMETYTERFGRSMVDDFALHGGGDEGASVLSCYPPLAPSVGDVGRYRLLEVETGCDQARVENNFAKPDEIQVQWRIEVSEDETGPWQVIGSPRVDAEYLGVEVDIVGNECATSQPRTTPRTLVRGQERRQRVWLGAGTYKVSIRAPLDDPGEFQTLLSGPCRWGEDSCRAGQRCDGEVCIPEAVDPLSVGASCSLDAELSDPCEAGSRCVGSPASNFSDIVAAGRCVALCHADADCPTPQRCHASGLCGVECEVDASSCAGSDLCVSGWGGSPSACLPDGRGDSPFCKHDFECESGSVCGLPPPIGAIGAIGLIGCRYGGHCLCEQLCNVNGSGRPCPSHLSCVSDEDRATCQQLL